MHDAWGVFYKTVKTLENGKIAGLEKNIRRPNRDGLGCAHIGPMEGWQAVTGTDAAGLGVALVRSTHAR